MHRVHQIQNYRDPVQAPISLAHGQNWEENEQFECLKGLWMEQNAYNANKENDDSQEILIKNTYLNSILNQSTLNS